MLSEPTPLLLIPPMVAYSLLSPSTPSKRQPLNHSLESVSLCVEEDAALWVVSFIILYMVWSVLLLLSVCVCESVID